MQERGVNGLLLVGITVWVEGVEIDVIAAIVVDSRKVVALRPKTGAR
jgi:hypothetical protein